MTGRNEVPVLRFEDVNAGYAVGQVLHGVSLTVGRGEAVCLLGRNGAGKTTTMRAIMGLLPHRRGLIEFEATDVIGWPPHRIARAGIGYVPEDRRIFPTLTVQENLELARRTGGGDQDPPWEEVCERFPALLQLRSARGATLSGGEQQMLAIARALMSRPKLLLCDEPSLGLAPLITKELFNIIGGLNDRWGIAVLLVEQNANLAIEIADRVYVLETGTFAASGAAAEMRDDESIRKAYLGY